jgi:hydroxymethylpyrimidine pyrophosphatase-like HAD family hydrolase
MKAAFYKGTQPGVAGNYNRIVRWWDQGVHSHCELIFSDGISASSSFTDGGVRFKQIEYDPLKWDFIQLPDHLEPVARKWFEDHIGCEYDTFGNLRFVIDFLPDDADKRFCSEALAEALGIPEAWRFSPSCLYIILKFLFQV